MSRQGSILQEYDHHQQLMRIQDQVHHHYDGPATPLHQQPITMSLSRFDSSEGTASLVFCLQDASAAQTTLAPWNSIYIPKQYRVPIPGQRQSSPGECDLALKIFPRLAVPGVDSEPYRAQDLTSVPCERCKNKKRDIFQIAGVDPAMPSPQRLFFSTGEIKLLFKICCPSWHHTEADVGYILTFELHHGKHVLLSETFKNAGPGLVPEPIPAELVKLVPLVAPVGVRAIKRKSSPTATSDVSEAEAHTLARKRSTLMSLNNIVSTGPTPPATEEPPSPIAAVVPHSPMSYQESEDPNLQTRNKSASYEDTSNKSSRSGSAKVEDIPGPSSHSTFSTKPARKRQEPLELSELGIGQRASANLHAAYVNGQLKERAKEGLVVPLLETPKKPLTKPKPQHSCPEPDCDKSFSRLFNLRSHMRTHSKARPFVCEDCNFAFSRRHDRDRHAKKHLSEKPYKCIVCDATFVRQDALVRHLRMDGVQNMCMAAMEQRSMQLGEGGENNYMLAAKQQAHDEQLQDQRDADEKRKAQKQKQQVQQQHAAGIADLLKHSGVVSDSKDRPPKPEFLDIRPSLDKTLDANLLLKSLEPLSAMETPELVVNDPPSFKNQKLESSLLEAALPHRPPRQDHPEGPMDSKPYASSSSRRPQYTPPQLPSQPPPPSQPPQPSPQPQPSQPSQPGPEYYGDSYGQGSNGSHGYYTTPSSRSHSRNHSQSSYPSSEYQTPVYHPHASPAPLAYHPSSSKHAYRDEPYYSGDSMTPTQVPTLPLYDDMPPPSHRPTRAFEEPQQPYSHREAMGDTPGAMAHPPPHEDAPAVDPDKSIFEAAVGLLRIRSSQW
ncbi:hypothetical protein BGZ52_007265 [Haplosporangium bisporale]|nr:hypothetical protein BGZ52_007265 [Haplosporangium bisporale]KAF9204470.1 hypothetical protein BGZ59_001029 [Podila verticillata]